MGAALDRPARAAIHDGQAPHTQPQDQSRGLRQRLHRIGRDQDARDERAPPQNEDQIKRCGNRADDVDRKEPDHAQRRQRECGRNREYIGGEEQRGGEE